MKFSIKSLFFSERRKTYYKDMINFILKNNEEQLGQNRVI